MTDPLDDLKSALDAATPAPDTAKKAAHLALAQKNFADLQGSRDPARPMSDRPARGFWTGTRNMLNSLTSRAGLVTSTALVAVAFVAFSPMGEDLMRPVRFSKPTSYAPEPAPLSEDRADLADSTPLVDPVMEAPVVAAPQEQVIGRTLSVANEAQGAAPAAKRLRAASSPTAGVPDDSYQALLPEADNTEAFANEDASPVHVTTEDPVSTFSIDVDTASYTVARNSISNGFLPSPEAVRIEEMINYFPYAYPAPEDGLPFSTSVSVTQTPWNAETQLVHIGIQGAMPAIADRPPLNLVFLIDTSGSMRAANKLPLLKQSFALMLAQLRPEDQVAIVAYAGSAGQVLKPTDASERSTIMAALNRLDAGGSTAGQAGLEQAYALAAQMSDDGDVSRVILATDGDFNVGITNRDDLKTYISDQRNSGTYLSVLGFGRGNLNDALMQTLAQNGNGQAAYIDTLAEAQKVLVDQLTGSLFPIADDVKIQVEFNPSQVSEYRLIGYETRHLRREDFNNDAVDAGEIGAGHSVTALYEITPVGSPAQLTDPLRYQTAEVADTSDEIGFLRLRYKEPGAATSQLIEQVITDDLPALPDTGFAAAIAGFGQLLRDGVYLNGWGYDEAIALASANRGDDPFGYRTEAIQLMRLAQSLDAQ